MVDYSYDVVVVGVGGVGLRAVFGFVYEGFKIVCIIKLFFIRSYIVVV